MVLRRAMRLPSVARIAWTWIAWHFRENSLHLVTKVCLHCGQAGPTRAGVGFASSSPSSNSPPGNAGCRWPSLDWRRAPPRHCREGLPLLLASRGCSPGGCAGGRGNRTRHQLSLHCGRHGLGWDPRVQGGAKNAPLPYKRCFAREHLNFVKKSPLNAQRRMATGKLASCRTLHVGAVTGKGMLHTSEQARTLTHSHTRRLASQPT